MAMPGRAEPQGLHLGEVWISVLTSFVFYNPTKGSLVLLDTKKAGFQKIRWYMFKFFEKTHSRMNRLAPCSTALAGICLNYEPPCLHQNQ